MRKFWKKMAGNKGVKDMAACVQWGSRTVAVIRRHKHLKPEMTSFPSYDTWGKGREAAI